ncbi:glycosyltransferase [Deltaproteobacteria bacterium]|nr:glycosyltransferase [Deltaproteobacteria bacterium]
MKISILTPDFSHNCFGRAWLLAKLLQKNYEIEVIGPIFGDDIWRPLKDECDFPIKIVKGSSKGQFEFKKMLRLISGEVIYASKPLMASFGVSIVKKFFGLKTLVLDIDDWELGFGKEFYDSLSWYKKINDFRLSISNFRSYYYSIILDRLVPFANAVTVSGDVLRREYGGTVIWHGRDSDLLDPAKFNSYELKKKHLHIGDKSYLVSFIGSPRPHKGLEDLIKAIEDLDNKDIFLMIVGMDNSKYCQKLTGRINSSIIKERVLVFPEQPFEMLPEYLAISDLTVIPQKKEAASYGQVPAKLFDAMSMAKPIIATKLYDIPFILNGCGWIIEPDDTVQLKETIDFVITHPAKAAELGLRARERFEQKFSSKIMEERLFSILSKITRTD